MLQQTTVGAVLRRYDGFLRRFPDVRSLAAATEEEVLAAWSGLGYYARARNLRRAAQSIVADHGGSVPSDPARLSRLPGFGDYMARAVASLAYGARVPAAEANVDRVFARVFALEGAAGSAALRSEVLSRAASLLPKTRPGDFTAALMDLGQLVCTPRRPSCARCPIAGDCAARRAGTVEAYPRRRARPEPVRVSLAAAFVEERGRFLLVRRRSTWLDGMWEFPSGEGGTPAAARRALAARLRPLGVVLPARAPLATARHSVVNRRIAIEVFRARVDGAAPRRGGARWFRAADLATAAVPTLTRKIWGQAQPFGLMRINKASKALPDPL